MAVVLPMARSEDSIGKNSANDAPNGHSTVDFIQSYTPFSCLQLCIVAAALAAAGSAIYVSHTDELALHAVVRWRNFTNSTQCFVNRGCHQFHELPLYRVSCARAISCCRVSLLFKVMAPTTILAIAIKSYHWNQSTIFEDNAVNSAAHLTDTSTKAQLLERRCWHEWADSAA